MSETNVDLSFLSRQIQGLTTEIRAIRKDFSDARQLAAQSFELAQRRERRDVELRDDLEMMLKIELGGTMANIQTAIEAALDRMDDRFLIVDGRLNSLELKP